MLAVSSADRLSSPITPQSSSLSSPALRSPNATPSDASLELSFDYEFDVHGNFIRVSKGSNNSSESSPPTFQMDSNPVDYREPSDSPSSTVPPSHVAPLRRTSLSRSESAPSAAAMEAQPSAPARSFQRVASGSALTPGSRATFALSRKLGPPQRIPIEEVRVIETKHRLGDQSRPNEEKENIVSSRQLPVVSGSRIGKPMKRYASGVSSLEIPDSDTLRGSQRRLDPNEDTSGDEQIRNNTRPRSYAAVPITASSSLSSSAGTRPRRSASFSDASSPFSSLSFSEASKLISHSAQDDKGGQYPSNAYIQQYKSVQRPASSLGAARPRRVTYEEKMEQEKQMQYQMELEQAGMVARICLLSIADMSFPLQTSSVGKPSVSLPVREN
jgi:hypothetical protein